ncbi:type II secretion system protein GspL [Yersinia artesiana]|uniref:type II secretion system protein GspL n=1 Tax=Yersinia artesiana TaxID=2890315 RepID=UPI001582EFD3|nr:type II secretion system protein GspL [Yersinia artesiana]
MNNAKNAGLSSKILIIRLGSHVDDPIYWYTEIVDGNHKNSGRLCDYTELGNIPFLLSYDVKILVSTSYFVFRKIELIGRWILKSERSLAFSLEKTIVSDIEDFHTIILKSDSDFCYVAAVEHKLMNRWLEWLANVGVFPTAMIPDVLALPFNDERCFPVKLDDEWLIRNSEVSGFSVKDAIFKSLCLSALFSCPKNKFSHFYSQTSSPHFTDNFDVLRIMASNIENNHVNLLTGRYYRHRKKFISNASLFRPVCLFLLLSIVMCFNSWHYKKDILRDTHMLNVALQSFHTQYPLVKQYIDEDSINANDAFYYSADNVVKLDFINLLHGVVENFGKLDVTINNIIFSKDENKVLFNINIINRDWVDQVLNEIDKEEHQLNISKIINNDGTCDIVFEYNL